MMAKDLDPALRVYRVSRTWYRGEALALRALERRITALEPKPRDREIVSLLNSGHSCRQVSADYGVSAHRVRSIRREVEDKRRKQAELQEEKRKILSGEAEQPPTGLLDKEIISIGRKGYRLDDMDDAALEELMELLLPSGMEKQAYRLHLEGLAYPAIGSRLGLSRYAVERLVNKARDKMGSLRRLEVYLALRERREKG